MTGASATAGGLAEPITWQVECSGADHPVTLHPDWTLTTPHDLAAERVGVALGGRCPCVDLADRVLPAARGYVTHRLRLRPAAITQSDEGAWLTTVAAVGCCGDQGFPQARDAAAHLRRGKHWALRYGASEAQVQGLARRVLDAVAAARGDAALAQVALELRLPPDAHAPALAEPFGLTVLWDAGLHPDHVTALVDPQAPPPTVAEVLNRAYGASARQGGHQGGRRGRRRPDERRAWLTAGIPLDAVTRLLADDHYSLDDVRILAARLSRPLAEAARIMARWHAAGMSPPVDTLVGLYWGPMLMDNPPPADAIDATCGLAGQRGVTATRTDVALALVRTGSPAAAVTLLGDVHRRPDDPYSP